MRTAWKSGDIVSKQYLPTKIKNIFLIIDNNFGDYYSCYELAGWEYHHAVHLPPTGDQYIRVKILA